MKVTLFIILLALITIAPSIYYGNKLFDGKVTEKPYETGLDYNKIKHIIEDNGLALADIKTAREGENVNVSFTLRMNEGTELDGLTFYIERPASTSGTQTLKAEAGDDGAYHGSFTTDGYGNFILEARAKVSGTEISFQNNFYINQ